MSFLGSALGIQNEYQADPTKLMAPVTDVNPAMKSATGAIQQQQSFVNALNAQGGLQNQANVFNQQQALANQLQQQSQGRGPSVAQNMLNQSTGQNIANQAALMASQRGAGANAGLMARQAAMQGGNIQQQAAGQAATMRAQEQLAAQQALMQQQQAMQGVAGQQVGQQAQGVQTLGQLTQQQQAQMLGQAQNQNQNQLAIQGINAGVAQANANQSGQIAGGVLQGAGAALGLKLAHGGQVPCYDEGGSVDKWAAYRGKGDRQASAEAAQRGVQKAAQDNPISKAVSWIGSKMADGGQVSGPKSEITHYLLGLHNYKSGGKVDGHAQVHGDSPKNDTVPAMLSPGEVVIPRSIMQSKDPAAAAAEFVRKVLAKQAKKA